MDAALKQVNNVVFSKSLNESQQNYDVWSATYDEDLKALGCLPSLETAKMFKKYGMDSNVLLDLGGGRHYHCSFQKN